MKKRGAEALGVAGERLVGLTIAGFDPSSGAGVTADLKVFAAHGIYGMAAVDGFDGAVDAGRTREPGG